MQRALIVGVLCLALPALSGAGEAPVWYRIGEGRTGRIECMVDEPGGGLFDLVRMFGETRLPYRLDDVHEGGQVVETTLTAPDFLPEPWTYFRTKQRCEDTMRKRREAYKAGQQQRERQLDKYW